MTKTIVRGPAAATENAGNTFAYIYYKACLFPIIVQWLEKNLDLETGDMRMNRSIVCKLQKAMNALKLEPAYARARDVMCETSNVKSIIKVIWFMAMAKRRIGLTMCPMMASSKFVEDRFMEVCRCQYDYMMVYKGFNAIGRSIDLREQPTFTHMTEIEVEDKSDIKSYYVYNPMTATLVWSAMKAMPATAKGNLEARGAKRSAPFWAFLLSMIHLFYSIKTMMTMDKASKRVDKDSGPRRTLLRMLMTFLALSISLTFPNRCIEYATFSWFDIKERVVIDGTYYDIPLIVRCMLSPEERKHMPEIKYYYMMHYCGKMLRKYASKLMHVIPGFASLVSLPVVFEFVARIMLCLVPHLIIHNINNPQAMMMFEVPNVKLSDATNVPIRILNTSTFGIWLKKFAVPFGAVKDSWIMPYTSRVSFARLITAFQLLVVRNPVSRLVCDLMRVLFGHTPDSTVIEDTYATHGEVVQIYPNF